MNYEKIYSLLIESRKNRTLDPNEYYEKHHIWPKSLGGLNEDWNIVYLTAKEHYIAHELLYKMCEGEDKYKMGCAWHFMCYGKNGKKEFYTARQFEKAKRAMNGEVPKETKRKMSDSQKGILHFEESKRKMSEVKKGKSHFEESKRKMSEVKSGEKHPFHGKQRSKEERRKISEGKTGRKRSKEERRKISEGQKGKKQNIVICTYCGKQGGKPLMKRYHFDNCKYKNKLNIEE